MTGKTHLAFGIGTGVVAATFLNPVTVPIGIGVMGTTIIGSLAPDIDSRTSKISKRMKTFSKIISKAFGHRGFIHSPACMLVTYILVSMLLRHFELEKFLPILYGYLLGYGGHLFLDMLTKGGIPLLYPFNKTKIHLTNVKTGGKGEKVLFIITCIFSLIGIGVYTYIHAFYESPTDAITALLPTFNDFI